MDIVAPSSKLLDESGGSLIFTVPLTSPYEIAPLFKLIEGQNQTEDFRYDANTDTYQSDENPVIQELKSYISDCGISHSTLEEVFMKVTGKKKPKQVLQKESSKDLKAKSGLASLTETNV